jgi:hypothetical protein
LGGDKPLLRNVRKEARLEVQRGDDVSILGQSVSQIQPRDEMLGNALLWLVAEHRNLLVEQLRVVRKYCSITSNTRSILTSLSVYMYSQALLPMLPKDGKARILSWTVAPPWIL